MNHSASSAAFPQTPLILAPRSTSGRAAASIAKRVTIETPDRAHLIGRLYEPTSAPDLSVLCLPGIGVPQRAFRHLAAWLMERGVRVLSVDYRGIGDSSAASGVQEASLTTWARSDAVSALNYLGSLGEKRVSLVAHSFGGQMLGLVEELGQVERAVLVGAQLGHREHWSGMDRARVEFFWRVALPLGMLSDPVPSWILGHALPRSVARQWRNWALGSDWFFEEFPDARARLSRVSCPVLLASSPDDFVAPARAVRALADVLPRRSVRTQEVHPRELGKGALGHLGLLRPGAEPVWSNWLRFLGS